MSNLTLLKPIVALLLLANAGYFLWNRGIAAAGGGGRGRCAAEPDPGLRSGASRRMRPEEASHAGGAAGAPPDSHDESPASLLTNVKRCVSVGPFRDMSEAARAASTLRGGGYDPRQRVADGEVWAGVWVYLPLPPSKAPADQMRDKLKSGGIDDALEMPGPNDTSVISLGLFSDPKRAQARVAQAQALQLNPGDRRPQAQRQRLLDRHRLEAHRRPAEPGRPAGRVGPHRAARGQGLPVGGGRRNERADHFARTGSVLGALVGYGFLAVFLALVIRQVYRLVPRRPVDARGSR